MAPALLGTFIGWSIIVGTVALLLIISAVTRSQSTYEMMNPDAPKIISTIKKISLFEKCNDNFQRELLSKKKLSSNRQVVILKKKAGANNPEPFSKKRLKFYKLDLLSNRNLSSKKSKFFNRDKKKSSDFLLFYKGASFEEKVIKSPELNLIITNSLIEKKSAGR